MPNIKLKQPVNQAQLSLCLGSIADQIYKVNGVTLRWNFQEEKDRLTIHYDWEILQDDKLIKGQKLISKMNKNLKAGAYGVQFITNGEIKRAIRLDMKGRGFPVEFVGWF